MSMVNLIHTQRNHNAPTTRMTLLVSHDHYSYEFVERMNQLSRAGFYNRRASKMMNEEQTSVMFLELSWDVSPTRMETALKEAEHMQKASIVSDEDFLDLINNDEMFSFIYDLLDKDNAA